MSLDWADQPHPALLKEDIFEGKLPFADKSARSGDDPNDDALPQSILLNMCERAAPRLNIDWLNLGIFMMGSCWDPLPS